MTTVIVGGALANKPMNGGEAWVRLSWVEGFRRLGFDAYLFEEIRADALVGPDGEPSGFGESANRAWFEEVVARFGLQNAASLTLVDGAPEGEDSSSPPLATCGLPWERALEVAGDAALLVNIGGHLGLGEVKRRPRRSVYVDIDPGFTQFWEAQGISGARLEGHDLHYTIGEAIGEPGCPIPALGLEWRAVRQPVVLDAWPAVPHDGSDRFTTVGSWRGAFGPIQNGERLYGLKVHEFRRFIDLPGRVRGDFEIALDIHPDDAADLGRLLVCGWRVVDPRDCAGHPEAFRTYVQGSGAEFSVAQGIYVETGSGWFSDRSTRYLASGRPVLVQDTGLRGRLPVDEGLLVFGTMEEAEAGVRRIRSDPLAHAQAARDVAERFFDSDRVLGRFADEVGVAP